MNREELRDTEQVLNLSVDGSLERILLSSPVDKDVAAESCLRPLLLKEELVFQAEEQVGKQAFHHSMSKEEAVDYIKALLDGSFRQAEIASINGSALILVSKKGEVAVKAKRSSGRSMRIQTGTAAFSHNRKKQYILEEGKSASLLAGLGVITGEGKIVSSRYNKYRQISRFLESIEDILPNLDQTEETTTIGFGCRKSYLTSAMHYYLKVLKGYLVHIIGLDLEQDVIDHCSSLGRQYGYDRLDFYHRGITSYQGAGRADMVATLHAYDTATDYALEKAIDWRARVIPSVPYYQRELAEQMENDPMRPVLQYGLIRGWMAALYTDAIRRQVLEYRGYRTQVLEFIDMEHTPKNTLTRAILRGRKKDNGSRIREPTGFMRVELTIVKLLVPKLLDPEPLPPEFLVF